MIGKSECLLVVSCFLGFQSCGDGEPDSASEESPKFDLETRLSAIEASLLVTAIDQEGVQASYVGIALSPASFGEEDEGTSRSREFVALFPPTMARAEKSLIAILADTGLTFAERIKLLEIEGSPRDKFAILECRLPYGFPSEAVFVSDTIPSSGSKITLLTPTLISEESVASESNVEQQNGGEFFGEIDRASGTVVSTGDGESIQLDFEPGAEPPMAQSYIAVGADGGLLGVAVPKGGGSFQIQWASELKGIVIPEIRSLEFMLEEKRANENLFSIRLNMEIWSGINWDTLHAVVLPEESIVSVPSSGEVPPIFPPETLPAMSESERLNAQSSLSFREPVEILPGAEVSLGGQVFVEREGGRRKYFEPFHFNIRRSNSGWIFKCSFEDHPFASVLPQPEYEKELESIVEFSDANSLSFDGGIVQVFPLGTSGKILLQTDRSPYLHLLNVSDEILEHYPIPGQRDDFSDIYISAGSGHIFVLDSKNAVLEKWSHETGKLISDAELPGDHEYFAIAVAASRGSAPVMIVSDETVLFFSQSDLSLIKKTYAPRDAKEGYDRETFDFLHGPPEKGRVVTMASGDGLTYFVKLTSPSKNRPVIESVLFRPFQDPDCFRHRRQCDLLDLGSNGDILFRGTGLDRFNLEPLPRHTDGKFLCGNHGGSGYFTIESTSFKYVPLIPGEGYIVRLYTPDIEEPLFSSCGLPEWGLLEKDERFPSLMFFPELKRVLAFPATGEEVVIRSLEGVAPLNIPVKVSSTDALTVTRGRKMVHQLTFLKEPEKSAMIKGPVGVSFDSENHRLDLNLGLDFTDDRALCKFEFENDLGTITEHKIAIEVEGAAPSLLSLEDPWGRGSGEGKVPFKGVIPSILPMEERIADIIPVGGGELFAIYTSDDSTLQIFDPKEVKILALESLPGDYVMVTGNKEAVFTYYPFHGVIERRGIGSLAVEKTVKLKEGCVLSRFDTAHMAGDSTPIVCVEEADKDRQRDRLRFIDPESLQFLDAELEESFLQASGYDLPVCHGVSNHLALSEDGSMIVVANGVIQFDRTSAEHVSSALFGLDQNVVVSHQSQAILHSANQNQIRSGSIIDRSHCNLDFFKFDLEGKSVIGFDVAKQYLHPRTAQVFFFSSSMQRPTLYLHKLPEFDDHKSKLRLLEDNSLMGEHERIFYSSVNGILITVPWDNRSVVVRKIDLEEARASLE